MVVGCGIMQVNEGMGRSPVGSLVLLAQQLVRVRVREHEELATSSNVGPVVVRDRFSLGPVFQGPIPTEDGSLHVLARRVLFLKLGVVVETWVQEVVDHELRDREDLFLRVARVVHEVGVLDVSLLIASRQLTHGPRSRMSLASQIPAAASKLGWTCNRWWSTQLISIKYLPIVRV